MQIKGANGILDFGINRIGNETKSELESELEKELASYIKVRLKSEEAIHSFVESKYCDILVKSMIRYDKDDKQSMMVRKEIVDEIKESTEFKELNNSFDNLLRGMVRLNDVSRKIVGNKFLEIFSFCLLKYGNNKKEITKHVDEIHAGIIDIISLLFEGLINDSIKSLEASHRAGIY